MWRRGLGTVRGNEEKVDLFMIIIMIINIIITRWKLDVSRRLSDLEVALGAETEEEDQSEG